MHFHDSRFTFSCALLSDLIFTLVVLLGLHCDEHLVFFCFPMATSLLGLKVICETLFSLHSFQSHWSLVTAWGFHQIGGAPIIPAPAAARDNRVQTFSSSCFFMVHGLKFKHLDPGLLMDTHIIPPSFMAELGTVARLSGRFCRPHLFF